MKTAVSVPDDLFAAAESGEEERPGEREMEQLHPAGCP